MLGGDAQILGHMKRVEAWRWVFGSSRGISPERSNALQAFPTVATMEGVVWTKLSWWGLGDDWERPCPLNEQGTAGGAGGEAGFLADLSSGPVQYQGVSLGPK